MQWRCLIMNKISRDESSDFKKLSKYISYNALSFYTLIELKEQAKAHLDYIHQLKEKIENVFNQHKINNIDSLSLAFILTDCSFNCGTDFELKNRDAYGLPASLAGSKDLLEVIRRYKTYPANLLEIKFIVRDQEIDLRAYLKEMDESVKNMAGGSVPSKTIKTKTYTIRGLEPIQSIFSHLTANGDQIEDLAKSEKQNIDDNLKAPSHKKLFRNHQKNAACILKKYLDDHKVKLSLNKTGLLIAELLYLIGMIPPRPEGGYDSHDKYLTSYCRTLLKSCH